MQAFANQDVPYEQIVDSLADDRDPTRQPLFRAKFTLQNTPLSQIELPGLALETSAGGGIPVRADLTLTLEHIPQGYAGVFTYDTALFDSQTVQRMTHHFQTLLEAVGDQLLNDSCQGQRIWQLPLLDETESRCLLQEWHRQRGEQTITDPAYLMVQQAAIRHPDRVALVFDRGKAPTQVTFASLIHRVDTLCLGLRTRGVEPEKVAAIFGDRDPETVVGMLAVLAAGGSFLNLSPDLPTTRLIQILLAANATILLTTTTPPPENLKIIPVLSIGETIAKSGSRPTANPPIKPLTPYPVMDHHCAYLMFTSGSSGMPKGAAVSHGALSSYIASIVPRLELGDAWRFGLPTSLGADLGFTTVWAALVSGGQLHLIPKNQVLDATAYEAFMNRHHIDVIKMVPSHLAALRSGKSGHGGMPNKLLILGGEAAASSWLKPLRKLAHCRIINHYGPTETTIGTITHAIQNAIPETLSGTPPLGRPLPHVRVYVTDHHLQPQTLGATGELVLGGTSLARCYWNRPAATAAAFVPNPFSREPGERLYRTGDLVRFLKTGDLEFLGRRDRQIKLRGHRIELGEIECVLRQHPSIARAAIGVAEKEKDQGVLTAYIQWKAGTPDEEKATSLLNDYLKTRLPAAMVPGIYVHLEKLPQTASGKVDYRVLDLLRTKDTADETPTQRQPTALEDAIAAIWSEVLELNSVGLNDSFFDAGGHSLQAVLVISRIRKQLGYPLSVDEFFSHPSVASQAQFLKEAKKEASEPGLIPTSRKEAPPLSFAQQRLWFLNQLEGPSPTYNVAGAFALKGPLNGHALEGAIGDIVDRHEILRTRIGLEDGQPVQLAEAGHQWRMSLVDLTPLVQREGDRIVQLMADQMALIPFDLSRTPLMRVVLLRIAAQHHILLLCLHHIISDGWSMRIWSKELGFHYRNRVMNRKDDLPPLPIQYADFATWQRTNLQGPRLNELLDRWRTRLADAPVRLTLPLDFPRPPIPTWRGEASLFSIPKSTVVRLHEYSTRWNTTLFELLLTAFGVMLSRYSGQRDLVIGTPVANRNHAETETLIGFFVNTLALRLELDGRLSFAELVREASTVAREANTHQDLPFEKLVDELGLERNLSHHPLFQVMFVFRNIPIKPLQLAGLGLRFLETKRQRTMFDLTLALQETEDGLDGGFEFAVDLFAPATVAHMANHFSHLLENLVATPHKPAGQVPMLEKEELQKMLFLWNQEHPLPLPDICLHQLFEQRAIEIPDHICAVHDLWENDPVPAGVRCLSYETLQASAEAWAHFLRQRGVGPGHTVGLCAHRSLEMVVGLIAILKAGGNYLPLEPNYPLSRLELMLRDSRATVCLAQASLLGDLPIGQTALIKLSAKPPETDKPRVPQRPVVAEDLAYVIYTSGSTGTPKGAMITHRGICNTLLWRQKAMPLTVDKVVLQTTSFSFDASVWEFFGPLCFGARLILSDATGHNKHALPAALVLRHGVTAMQLPPSWLDVFLQDPLVAKCTSLKMLITGAEPLPKALRTRFFQKLNAALHDLYGPTETALDATYFTCNPDDPEPMAPIGRPISNKEIFLLDSHLQPVPIGATGELMIGGQGLARGYLHRPGPTAEALIPHPFSDEAPGMRLYKTGDLARYRPNGVLEFQGRRDRQIKLRGYRIEPGDIEAALKSITGAQEVVVLVRKNPNGEKNLVAFVRTGPEGAQKGDGAQSIEAAIPKTRELRRRLARRLPGYMVPAQISIMDRFPLTPNGKIDISAFPDPAEAERAKEARVPLATATQKTVAKAWAQVLDVNEVGRRDQFFNQGGHSLMAARLVLKLRQNMDIDLPMRAIFEYPVLEDLAGYIDLMVWSAKANQDAPAQFEEDVEEGIV